MRKQTKMLIGVLAVVVVAAIAMYATNTELLQGKMFISKGEFKAQQCPSYPEDIFYSGNSVEDYIQAYEEMEANDDCPYRLYLHDDRMTVQDVVVCKPGELSFGENNYGDHEIRCTKTIGDLTVITNTLIYQEKKLGRNLEALIEYNYKGHGVVRILKKKYFRYERVNNNYL
jgi:hypothetical protein